MTIPPSHPYRRVVIPHRPRFGEVRWMKNRYVRLVAYVSTHHWYWVPAEPKELAPNQAPMKGLASWHQLPFHPS